MKFVGLVGINRGFRETGPGVHKPHIEEIEVIGEIRSAGARWSGHEQAKARAQHKLSIIIPESDLVEYTEVLYVVWNDIKWSVVSIEYNRPRVELSLGGVYNG